MNHEASERQELERETRVLVDQADRLVRTLTVDVSDAGTFSNCSPVFREAADAYERLALAQKRTNPVAWERTLVDGRDGNEIMRRLWRVRQELEKWDRE